MLDLFLQVSHQSHCCRLVKFYEDPFFDIFPKTGFGSKAVEVDHESNHQGLCLVKIVGVEASVSEILQWFHTSIVKRHVDRLYWVDHNQEPARDMDALISVLSILKAPNCNVRLQTCPPVLGDHLQQALPLTWHLDPKVFQTVLYVIETKQGVYWNLHPAAESYIKSSRTIPQTDVFPSKAVGKLQEAIGHAKLDLEGLKLAVDLGAAPGSWSSYLADNVGHVIAVDRADMTVEALKPNVTHLRQLAEDAIPEIIRCAQGQKADLLVSDMNLHIGQVLKPVQSLLPILKPGGTIIVTLKFFGIGRQPRKWEDIALKSLEDQGMVDCKFVWCLANTVNERTLIARKQLIRQ